MKSKALAITWQKEKENPQVNSHHKWKKEYIINLRHKTKLDIITKYKLVNMTNTNQLWLSKLYNWLGYLCVVRVNHHQFKGVDWCVMCILSKTWICLMFIVVNSLQYQPFSTSFVISPILSRSPYASISIGKWREIMLVWLVMWDHLFG